MNSVRGFLAVVGLLLAGPALAVQFSIGATMGEFDYQEIDSGNGLRLSVSQNFRNSPWFVEAGLFDTGKGDVDPIIFGAPATARFDGYTGYVGYRNPFDKAQRGGSAVFVKGGFYQGTYEFDVQGLGAADDKSTGAALGVGLDWAWIPGVVAGRAQAEMFFDVEDFASENNISLLTLGLVFGGDRGDARSAPAARAPAPAPAASPAAAPAEPTPAAPAPEPPAASVPPPQPEPQPAPQAAPVKPVFPPPSAAPVKPVVPQPEINDPYARVIATAYAVGGATLKVSPTPAAKVQFALPANVAVELRAQIINATGLWWYGSVGGERGWIQASQLVPVAQ